jgi:threonine dehydrogenase-like Zn-dependent dehydrogenase
MKAFQFTAPKTVTMLNDVPVPEPKEGEVLVKCTYVALCGSNSGQFTGEGYYADGYPIPIGNAGHENLGVIVKSRCPEWKEGEFVLAQPLGYFGFAEYIISRPPAIAHLPQDDKDPMSLIVAQPLATELRALTRTGDVINKTCAVIGQGPMGLIFTHLLKLFGARTVIVSDKHAWRLKWSKHFGANHAIDASKEDMVEAVKELTNGDMLDFVVDASGSISALQTAAMLPKRFGKLLVFGMPHFNSQEFPWYSVFRRELQIVASVGPECGDFFQTAADMVVDGRSSILRDMVFPRMKWDEAQKAFELYTSCAPDVLKLTLTV